MRAIERTRRAAAQELLDARGKGGWWEGELSSSALSTATAVLALHLFTRARGEDEELRAQVTAGLAWLAAHANRDGGFGEFEELPQGLPGDGFPFVVAVDEAHDVCSGAQSHDHAVRSLASTQYRVDRFVSGVVMIRAEPEPRAVLDSEEGRGSLDGKRDLAEVFWTDARAVGAPAHESLTALGQQKATLEERA